MVKSFLTQRNRSKIDEISLATVYVTKFNVKYQQSANQCYNILYQTSKLKQLIAQSKCIFMSDKLFYQEVFE